MDVQLADFVTIGAAGRPRRAAERRQRAGPGRHGPRPAAARPAEGAALRAGRRVRLPDRGDAARRAPASRWLGQADRRLLPAVPDGAALLRRRQRRGARQAASRRRPWLGLPPLWATVVKVELVNIAFSVDSILVAVAMSPKTWVILTGGLLGIVAMRVVIGQLLRSSGAIRRSSTAPSSSSRGSASSC